MYVHDHSHIRADNLAVRRRTAIQIAVNDLSISPQSTTRSCQCLNRLRVRPCPASVHLKIARTPCACWGSQSTSDDPSAGCSDLHRNFGVRSIWARRAVAARRAGSLKRGLYRRTVRRAEWRGLASVAPGGDHAATGARSWQVSASGVAALAGRRARTGRDEQATTRRGHSAAPNNARIRPSPRVGP